MTETQHTPVLLAETLTYLKPRSGGWYLDGTLGGGGHAEAILAASDPDGRLIGFDRDPLAIERSTKRLVKYDDRFQGFHASFSDAASIWQQHNFQAPDGAFLDLGLSSDQLADSERGFSFQFDAPLDLRFDTTEGDSASDILANIDLAELTEILGDYGDLRQPRQLAKRILEYREDNSILRTGDLIAASGLKHPRRLAQLFQAMRIAANNELKIVEQALPEIWQLMAPGGRLVILTFHSLEDRIAKHFMKKLAKDGKGTALTKKPLLPGIEELTINSRSRSAKLRAIEKI